MKPTSLVKRVGTAFLALPPARAPPVSDVAHAGCRSGPPRMSRPTDCLGATFPGGPKRHVPNPVPYNTQQHRCPPITNATAAQSYHSIDKQDHVKLTLTTQPKIFRGSRPISVSSIYRYIEIARRISRKGYELDFMHLGVVLGSH